MSHHAIDAYLDELLAPASGDEPAPSPAPTVNVALVSPVAPPAAAAPSPSPALPPAVQIAETAPHQLDRAPPLADRPAPGVEGSTEAPPEPSPAGGTSAPQFRRAGDTAPLTGAANSLQRSSRWLRMSIGRDHYAFELLRVQEVVRTVPILAMRGAAPSVLGVMNLRGRIVPVFDLGRWLESGYVVSDDRARIVVIERDDELIGVLVSSVEDVVTLGREHIEPPLANGDPGAIVGIARAGHAPTVLLDADALFG